MAGLPFIAFPAALMLSLLLINALILSGSQAGLEIATDTSAFATKLFTFAANFSIGRKLATSLWLVSQPLTSNEQLFNFEVNK